MHAELEMLTGVVRVFSEGKGYGDKYEHCFTVCRIDHNVLEIVGAMDVPDADGRKAIKDMLEKAGYKRAEWAHYANGKRRRRVIYARKASG